MAIAFDQLNIGIAAPAEAVYQTVPFTPVIDGVEAQNGDGEPLVLQLLPFSTPEGMREYRKAGIKYGLRELGTAHPKASEKQLDALAERESASGPEIVSRMVAGWNLKDVDGADIPSSLENKVGFFSHFVNIAVAVTNRLVEVTDELGKSNGA